MGCLGTILLADDESSFSRSTAELLRNDSYVCDVAATADETIALLGKNRYDLLIADIRMPGNPGLRIVHAALELTPGMAVILVTGYPSLESAVEAVGLPVLAYLTKPLDYDLLRRHVEAAVQRRPVRRILSRVIEDLHTSIEELRGSLEGAARPAEGGPSPPAVTSVTLRRLAMCVHELLMLPGVQPLMGEASNLCNGLGCPQWPALREVLEDAVRVLQETKRRFKSKELGEVRDRLSRLLRNAGGPELNPEE